MSKEVIIYTFKTCPFCIKAKNLLNKEGINFTEIDITDKEEKLDELEKITGSGTVPQIFIDDRFIGGCDDLVKLHQDGDFDKLFKQK